MLSSLRVTVSVDTCLSGSVSIFIYVVLFIVLLRGRFGSLSRAPAAFDGVEHTCDSFSFRSVLGELPDWFCYVCQPRSR